MDPRLTLRRGDCRHSGFVVGLAFRPPLAATSAAVMLTTAAVGGGRGDGGGSGYSGRNGGVSAVTP